MARKKTTGDEATSGQIMLVNDVPGQECRIAILRNGRVEDLFTERVATATSVGNIYKGRVTNVESAIQAAFVEFGKTQRGFLHISDLHPRHFPGGEQTEKVGRKTSHRQRPLIQKALKKGDEILVQVIKEGIGTKGPTLTSYLSIPGRLMVMMPYMDRVGVTRRVENPDERKAMRKVLDSLDLPPDFGFILRTAGMGASKRDLTRDVAYLTRMWKVMERRIEKIGVPAELYTESDLVLRTVRDVLNSQIESIVVDSEQAYERLQGFLRVIAPRSAPKVVLYRRAIPLFHAFDVERQIETIHAREVDLPSGGRLVIDQTEALVAIDVNSGRSRSSRDSETNAYNTNMEAVEEIARQLRLRDLGGLVINDLIDMRMPAKRREVYRRFGELLKEDRSRTTILPISDFGILEMTRQRMRPSIRMANYVDCPTCAGQGEIKSPDLVAADAIREIGWLMHCKETAKVEVVVSPPVASSLLSTRRRVLDDMEDESGKPIDVRVSESIAVDRVAYYAYDNRGADLDLNVLTSASRPTIEDLIAEAQEPTGDASDSSAEGKTRRRGRRRRSTPPADAAAIALSGEFQEELAQLEAQADAEEAEAAKEEAVKSKKKKRRRRRKKPAPLISETSRLYVLAKAMDVKSKDIVERWQASGGEKNLDFVLNNHMSSVTPEQASVIQGWFAGITDTADEEADAATTEGVEAEGAEASEGEVKRRRRRRGGRGRGKGRGRAAANQADAQSTSESSEAAATGDSEDASGDSTPPKKKRSRRRRPAKSKAETESASEEQASPKQTRRSKAGVEPKTDTVEEKPAPRRRTLYGSRRKLNPGEAADVLASEGVD
ncbi:MAG: Rne/Rng family ribonuclease [Phycisphaerales bacterium]|nr:Rne/Rng family ribonuclease [Phycisphaerales bacterium]